MSARHVWTCPSARSADTARCRTTSSSSWSGLESGRDRTRDFPADESSPQGRAFSTGEPVICSDLNKDATFLLPSFYAEHGIISTVDVVIKKTEGQPYGVLEIDSPVQHDYDQHDIDYLTGFANVLAEAVNSSTATTS
ncbi:MAG: GAF domain-containing protein [Pseudomonadota bacterium]